MKDPTSKAPLRVLLASLAVPALLLASSPSPAAAQTELVRLPASQSRAQRESRRRRGRSTTAKPSMNEDGIATRRVRAW